MKREKIVERIRMSTISVVDTAVEAIRSNDEVRTGLRLHAGDHIGVAGALGRCDLAALEKQASDALALQIPYPFALERERRRHEQLCSDLTGLEQGLAELERVLDELRLYKDFSFSGNAKLIKDVNEHSNDLGLELRSDISLFAVSLLFKEANSGSILDGFVGHVGLHWDGAAFLHNARETLEAYRNRVELPANETLPVVKVASGCGMDSPFGFFMNSLNARSFATGASALAKHHRERVFNRAFTLWQSRRPETMFTPFFDAEGVVNHGDRIALIDAGQVVAPYADKKSAADFGLPPTGAASAAYDGLPSLACPSFEALPAAQTMADLLDGRPAVFVSISQGGDFTPDGQYAAPVQLAFLFDGKRLIGRLPQLQISSTVFDMFGDDFIGVGSDTWPGGSKEHLLAINMRVAAL